MRERQEKKEALLQRYAKKAPPLAGFVEQAAQAEKLEVTNTVDRPEVPHGKRYGERSTTVHLKKAGLLPISKFLEALEKSGFPVEVSRLTPAQAPRRTRLLRRRSRGLGVRPRRRSCLLHHPNPGEDAVKEKWRERRRRPSGRSSGIRSSTCSASLVFATFTFPFEKARDRLGRVVQRQPAGEQLAAGARHRRRDVVVAHGSQAHRRAPDRDPHDARADARSCGRLLEPSGDPEDPRTSRSDSLVVQVALLPVALVGNHDVTFPCRALSAGTSSGSRRRARQGPSRS